jgi:hypothetical protein
LMQEPEALGVGAREEWLGSAMVSEDTEAST